MNSGIGTDAMIRTPRSRPVASALLAICLSCLPAHAQTDGGSAAIALERGLRPTVLEPGAMPPGWSLRERMAHHRVPGVAVAVLQRLQDLLGLLLSGLALGFRRFLGMRARRHGQQADQHPLQHSNSPSVNGRPHAPGASVSRALAHGQGRAHRFGAKNAANPLR